LLNKFKRLRKYGRLRKLGRLKKLGRLRKLGKLEKLGRLRKLKRLRRLGRLVFAGRRPKCRENLLRFKLFKPFAKVNSIAKPSTSEGKFIKSIAIKGQVILKSIIFIVFAGFRTRFSITASRGLTKYAIA
jgi:hypothetical protein